MSWATLAVAVAEHSELASEVTVLESDRLYLLLSCERLREWIAGRLASLRSAFDLNYNK